MVLADFGADCLNYEYTNSIGPLTPEEIKLDAELEILGYCIEWIRWGMLTEPEFKDQLHCYQDAVRTLRDDPDAEADNNREHYRWGHLQEWLSTRDDLTDKEFYQLLWLHRHQDEIPQRTLLHLLIRGWYVSLTDSQFEYLSRLVVADGFESLAVEMAALRRCYKEPWSSRIRESLLKDAGGRHQAEVVNYLIDGMDRDDLIAFSERGASKKVRNLANQKLNSRQFRS
tara:strand:- start:464199 stop:464882 length:684 start_codon:yes stop_codon:yes gene_type:complete